jgi:hypothetical protein
MKNIENINNLARLRPFSVCCNWGDRTALGREAGDLAGTYQALLSPKTQGPARPSSLLGSLACRLSFPLKEILNLSDSLFPCLQSSQSRKLNRVDRCSQFRRQFGLTHSRSKTPRRLALSDPDLKPLVVERKKKKLARSEGEQVLGANRASKMTV